ncbi:hypothetical protein FN846DRAFT_992846 [Sphaerosporella brunnea]|uniref:Uncharacterized protein n=1 Tax=Sphaerosporella brunnea TaxID=1250544 RepID=A0A5J5FCL3_9PEZI|nr:hypothetical protein FN846DRAFT_992846 [Sphaerosporella brunnea]
MRRDQVSCMNSTPSDLATVATVGTSRTQHPTTKHTMSERFAQQLAELDEEELELEASGLDPEELEAAREEIRLQREELEVERELQEAQEELEELEELEGPQVIGNAEPSLPPAVLTPLQQSLQRVYGSAFTELSADELQGYLRLEMHETTPGEECRMERELARERHGRIEPPPARSLVPVPPALPQARRLTVVPHLAPPAERTPSISPTRPDAELQRKKRTHLTQDDKLVLMNLCVDYQAEHVQNNKGRFWQKITELLDQETGVRLGDPSRTVAGLVVQRQVLKEVPDDRKSGSVQKDDELCQKVDEWIRHEEALEEMTARASATPTAQEKEKEESEIQRRFMFARLSQKRTAEAANSEGEVEPGVVVLDEDASNEEVAQAAARARKQRKTTRAASGSGSASFDNGFVEVGASIDRMGTTLSDGMLNAVRELNGARHSGAAAAAAEEEKFKELRKEIAQDRETAAHHRELMDTQRIEDQVRADRQRTEDLERAEKQRREDRERQEKQRQEDKAEDKARSEDLLARLFGKLEELKKN